MTLKISTEATQFRIAFSYDPKLVEAVKSLPVRRFDPVSKTWTTPLSGAAQLAQLLARIQTPIEYVDDTRAAIEQSQVERASSIASSRLSDADIVIEAPEGLAYLPYQKAGIAYAASRQSVLIGDEMGLGKTIQAIGIANTDELIKSILIICPASLKLNWAREWSKWDVYHRTVGIVNGVIPTTQVCIVNYDILKKHIIQLRERVWDYLIVDEAHYLKNHKAQRTQFVLGKKDRDPAKVIPPLKATRRAFLTGTPIPNKPIEAWGLVSSLAPIEFSSWANYAIRYCAGYQNGYGWDVTGASNLEELQDRLRASIMVRRLKKDVLTELPPKRRQIIELATGSAAVEKESAAWTHIQDRLESLRAAVQLAKAESDNDYVGAVEALREGASAAFTEMSKLRHDTAVAKIPYVIEHLTDAMENQKIICFAHHRDVIAKIVAEFPGCVSITGETSMVDRQAAVDKFQNDPECKLIVGNLQAMGVGLTLTASAHVIFTELDWVPGVISQAEDRAHRIGQLNSVLIQHLVLDGSIDSVMVRRLIAKQEIIDKALDATERSEINAEPIIPGHDEAATESISRAKVIEAAITITAEQITAIHSGLRQLSAMCDGASSLDGHGFSKIDTHIGKSLAAWGSLSPRQAVLGLKLVNKYRRQLNAELIATAKGN